MKKIYKFDTQKKDYEFQIGYHSNFNFGTRTKLSMVQLYFPPKTYYELRTKPKNNPKQSVACHQHTYLLKILKQVFVQECLSFGCCCFSIFQLHTLPKAEILSGKNARVFLVGGFSMKSSKKYPENMKKIMGAVWKLPAKQHCQSSQFSTKLS